ncbi:aldolase/citrate lyase family protein, partial [Vibrio vulnificus]|uniref:aldolase/citrate lyase family protein n=1 Tax=Vibrio vulnificus TaxID=672 RepID=UPI0039B63F81
MPGSDPRLLVKARTLPTDVVMIDLEDGVAPETRAATREAVARAVSEGGFGPREVVVRINALDTPYGADDLAAIAPAGPDAIVVP